MLPARNDWRCLKAQPPLTGGWAVQSKRVRQRPLVWKVSFSWRTVDNADCARWGVHLLLIWFAVQTSLHDMCHECGLVTHLRRLFYVSKNCVLCGQTLRSVRLFCLKTDVVATTFGYQHRTPFLINQKLRCIGIADLVFLEYFMAFTFLYSHFIWLLLFVSEQFRLTQRGFGLRNTHSET